MPKRSLRATMLSRRKHLAADDCLAKSLKAQGRLLATAEFLAAKTLALYCPIHNEVFTEKLSAAARTAGKALVFPRLCGDLLEFVAAASAADFASGPFGLLEPTGSEVISPEDLDLLVVPGLAFDQRGHRLGYGKGYYDRTLADSPLAGAMAGLCYEWQFLPEVPTETHDVCMDLIVTEERIRRFGPAQP